MSFDGESPSAVLYLPVKKLPPHDSSHPLPLHDPEGRRLRTQVNILPRIDMKAAAIACASLASILLTGCGIQPFTDTTVHTMAVSGTAFGGQPPITGSIITLFATGQSGYGSNGTVLGSATTDSHGNFNIASATGCGDPQQVYIVANGGNPGLTAGTNNSAIVLVAALGNCSSVSATTHVNLNEVTTIAAAYALSGFAGTGVRIGTSLTNPLGLQHAFQNAANIVDVSSGTPRSTTPAGNGTVPAALINSLADILEPCVNSTSPASGTCTTLFSNATPPAVTGLAAPANTWQAALDMAQYPGNKTAALYGLMLGTPSFVPTLGATFPNDLSIGIAYTAGLGTNGATSATAPFGIAADANDNLWITGASGAGLIELSSVGAVLSPNGGWGNSALQTASGASTRQVAVDRNGNIWTVDNASSGGNIYEYNPTASTTTITTPGTIPLSGIAVDGGNNIWYSTESASGTQVFGQLAYNSGSNTFAATPTTFAASNVIGAGGVAALTVDAVTNNVWGPSQGAGITNYFLSPYSAPVNTSTTGGSSNYAAAIDRNGNAWITNTVTGGNNSSLYKVTHGNPSGAPIVYNATVTGGLGLDGLQSIAIDGNNRLFLNSAAANTLVEFDPAIGTTGGNTGTFLLTASGDGFNPSSNTSGTGILNANRTATIDASGALWMVNSAGTQPVVQVLGIAAPTVAVLGQGKYGAKP